MWVFTKYGFYSAVCARQGDGSHGQPVDSNRMMVRARVKQHLDALKDRFPDLIGECEIKEFTGTDYAFRLFVEKFIWTKVMVGLAEDVDYDNFKSEVARHQGPEGGDYEHSLHEVWSVMNRLQGRTGKLKRHKRRIKYEDVARVVQRFDNDRTLIRSNAYGANGLHVLFGRLDRAVMNQAEDGEATVSRYAIWANTVRDHIAEAIRLTREGRDPAEAERLLTYAHNSLSAFSEVQALFDPFGIGESGGGI